MQKRSCRVHLRGEALNVGFDGSIKLAFHGVKVTPDGDFYLDDALGLKERCLGIAGFLSEYVNFMEKDDMLVIRILYFDCNIQNHILHCFNNSTKSQLISFRELIWRISHNCIGSKDYINLPVNSAALYERFCYVKSFDVVNLLMKEALLWI